MHAGIHITKNIDSTLIGTGHAIFGHVNTFLYVYIYFYFAHISIFIVPLRKTSPLILKFDATSSFNLLSKLVFYNVSGSKSLPRIWNHIVNCHMIISVCYIQSGPVGIWSNINWYYIELCGDWGKIWIIIQTHKNHPTSCFCRRTVQCLLWGI